MTRQEILKALKQAGFTKDNGGPAALALLTKPDHLLTDNDHVMLTDLLGTLLGQAAYGRYVTK
jgi:hypothetical protein